MYGTGYTGGDPMKAQQPAQGILLHRDYGDAMQYEVSCECGDSNHNHRLWVEAEDSNVNVTIYTTVKSKWYQRNRWRQVWDLLSKGYTELEADVIMNEQQALNYAETLKSAIKNSRAFAEQRKSNNKPT